MTVITGDRATKRRERGHELVAYLLNLAQNRGRDTPEGASARQALAELRRGANFHPGSRLPMVRHIARFLGDRPDSWPDECFYMVAALFAIHQAPVLTASYEHLKDRGLGAALDAMLNKSDSRLSHDNMEARLLALVNSGPATLPVHLRQAISLLSSAEVPLDWDMLLQDILDWRNMRRKVQDRWLREFYGAPVGRPRRDDVQDAGIAPEEITDEGETHNEG